MPTYDYECSECGYEFEAFHSMSAESLKYCLECGKPKLMKLIGPGAAIIVRGTDNPCHGGRQTNKVSNKKRKVKLGDRLGEGENKSSKPFWRDGKINKGVLKNPKKYIKEGKV